MRGVDFYWKKFLVFSLFLVLLIGGFVIWKNQGKTQAEFAFSNEAQFSSIYEQNYNIDITSSGKVIVNGRDATKDLKIYPDYYEVRVLLVDSSGSYIGRIKAVMNLPKAVSDSSLKQIVYAVHGVGSYRAYMEDSKTLVYEAEDISPEATLSVVANLPKNILTPGPFKRIMYKVNNISANNYAFGAAILPVVTLIIMLFMIIKRRKDQIISYRGAPIPAPPADLPPALPGVLIDGQVGAREIAATIISLASRGYIFIVKRKNQFTFGKRKALNLDNLPELHLYERILLGKIFHSEDYKSTRADVEMRVGHHIFSRKIAQVFLEIYNEATSLGFFIKNPAIVHRRWRYTGIALFFLGILGFIQGVIWAPDPKFTLFFWVGEIAVSTVIIKFSGLMPSRSDQGSRALNQWMAFRRYLKLNAPIEPMAVSEDKFNKFLPYAIVFGVEAEWARRFLRSGFTKPDWYESEESIGSLEEYISGLYPLISFVSQILAGSHEPTVE